MNQAVTRGDLRDARTFDRKASRKAKARAADRLDRRATTKRQRSQAFADETQGW